MNEPTLEECLLHYFTRLTPENKVVILSRLIIAVEAQNADQEI